MHRFAAGGLIGLCFIALLGCNDPKDPQTWIKQLRDITKPSPALPMGARFSVKAVRELQKLGDPVAVQPLCELAKDHKSPIILRAIVSFKDKKSIPTLISALDFTEDLYNNATIAAKALADFKATEAIDELTKVLERQLPIKSRANLAKLAAIEALADIGDKKAVPALIKVLERRPEQQDFLLNKRAADALGQIGDPKAIPVLVRALFMSSTIQGSAFPHARVALVRLGEPAVKPLIAAMEGKDAALNQMAKELSFREGVIAQKIPIVLGDMALPSALEFLRGQLAKADLKKTSSAGLIEAIGKIADKRAVPDLVKILKDPKANFKLRMQVCSALTVIGDKRSLPALLEMAEKGYIQKTYYDLREAAVMAYSRIVGAEAVKGIEKIKAMVGEEKMKAYKRTLGTFKEAHERVKVAVECKDDVACYGKKVNDKKLSLAQREKAGIMIGLLPDGRKALTALTEAVTNREPVLRLYFLESAKRIGKKTDTKLVETIAELARKDSKRKTKFLGADLASADKIALAVIQRQ